MYEQFKQNYEKCEKSLFLVAFGYLHNTEDAKDCVQEAVLSALKSLKSLRNMDHFKTWLTRIVVNKRKDFLRKQRYAEEFSDNLNIFYAIPVEEMSIIDCVCKMKQAEAIYITLRFYADMNSISI